MLSCLHCAERSNRASSLLSMCCYIRVEYKFNIINFVKKSSLFQSGMRPLAFSVKESGDVHNVQLPGTAEYAPPVSDSEEEPSDDAAHRPTPRWVRCGSNICYYNNCFMAPDRDTASSVAKKGVNFLSTLTFTYRALHDDDTVFFAYSFPYTYTMMRNELKVLANQHEDIMIVSKLCNSLLGNAVPLLTISDNVRSLRKAPFDVPISDESVSGDSTESGGGQHANGSLQEQEGQSWGGIRRYNSATEARKGYRKRQYVVVSARVSPRNGPVENCLKVRSRNQCV